MNCSGFLSIATALPCIALKLKANSCSYLAVHRHLGKLITSACPGSYKLPWLQTLLLESQMIQHMSILVN